ncbi:MAG: pyridoxal phosphate-dependent aminotransferase [Promethearchaeati archaeon]
MKVYLDKNEMPYPPPKNIINSVKECLKNINRYTPQEKVDELTALLANYNNIDEDRLFLSPGSDLLLKEFIFLYSNIEQIIIPDPTFIIIENAVEKLSTSVLKVKLSAPDFKFPVKFIKFELKQPTLIIIDNPNNPTGQLIINQKEVESLLQNKEVFLLIDEAYYEFSKQTVINLTEKYPNLAVMRTLSKSFGLAGSGIGYMVAGTEIRKKFNGLEIMLPYPSVIAATSALKNLDYLNEYINLMEKEKQRLIEQIRKFGFETYSSKTNFLLINTGIPNIAEKLANNKVYVYDASNYFSSGYIRVTISTEEENNYFLDVLEKIKINN